MNTTKKTFLGVIMAVVMVVAFAFAMKNYLLPEQSVIR